MQTFLGFIHSDAHAEKLRFLKFFLLSSHTKSRDESSYLCPAYILYVYVPLSFPTATTLAWLPSFLPY